MQPMTYDIAFSSRLKEKADRIEAALQEAARREVGLPAEFAEEDAEAAESAKRALAGFCDDEEAKSGSKKRKKQPATKPGSLGSVSTRPPSGGGPEALMDVVSAAPSTPAASISALSERSGGGKSRQGGEEAEGLDALDVEMQKVADVHSQCVGRHSSCKSLICLKVSNFFSGTTDATRGQTLRAAGKIADAIAVSRPDCSELTNLKKRMDACSSMQVIATSTLTSLQQLAEEGLDKNLERLVDWKLGEV